MGLTAILELLSQQQGQAMPPVYNNIEPRLNAIPPDPYAGEQQATGFVSSLLNRNEDNLYRSGDNLMNQALMQQAPTMPTHPLRPGEAGIGMAGALIAKLLGAKDRDINDFAQGFIGTRTNAQQNAYSQQLAEYQRKAKLSEFQANQKYRDAQRAEKMGDKFASRMESRQMARISAAAREETERMKQVGVQFRELQENTKNGVGSVRAGIAGIQAMGGNVPPEVQQALLTEAAKADKLKQYRTDWNKYGTQVGHKDRAVRMNAARQRRNIYAEFPDEFSLSPEEEQLISIATADEAYKAKLGEKIDADIESAGKRNNLTDAQVLRVKAETAAVPNRVKVAAYQAATNRFKALAAIDKIKGQVEAKDPEWGEALSPLNSAIKNTNDALARMKSEQRALKALDEDQGLSPEDKAELDALKASISTKEAELKETEGVFNLLRNQYMQELKAKTGKDKSATGGGPTGADARDARAGGYKTPTQELNEFYRQALQRAGGDTAKRNEINKLYRQKLAELNKK